jgi:hypothetical protein
MRVYTVDLTAREAEFVVDTVKADGDERHRVEAWNAGGNLVTLALGQSAVFALADRRGVDDDGHVDDDGGLWIGGDRHQMHALDNC